MEEIFPDFKEFGVSASLWPLIFLEIPLIFLDLDSSGAHVMCLQAAGSMRNPGSVDFENAVRTRKVIETRKSLPFLESGSPKLYKSGIARKTSGNRIFSVFSAPGDFRASRARPQRAGRARDEILGRSRDFLKEFGRNIPGF